MAGTRRHSQDSAASAPRILSTEDVATGQQPTSDPESPTSRSTRAFCTGCGSNIGEFFNSWHRVTGPYYVPALLGSYRSLLKSSDKQKAASNGKVLEGCVITSSSCPSANCIEPSLGFTVVDAPAGKENFINRDFFKLSRIELRCEVALGVTRVVEPYENAASDLLTFDTLETSSPTKERGTGSPDEAMEVDTRPTMLSQPLSHVSHGYHAYQHQSAPQPDLPLVSVSNIHQKTPNGPLPVPARALQDEAQHGQASPRDVVATPSSQQHMPSTTSHSRPTAPHSPGEHAYPRQPNDVSLDAIQRLQTQVSQNVGALAAQTRDIRQGEESLRLLDAGLRQEFAAQVSRQSGDIQRIDEAVAQVQLDILGMRQAIENMGHQLAITGAERQKPAPVPHNQPLSGQDSALELMAQQIAVISHKANEVDTLKIAIEILKNKLHRLEEDPLPAQPSAKPHQSPEEPIPRSTQVHSSHQTTSNAGQIMHAPIPTQLSGETSSSTATPEISHRPEPWRVQSSGWAAINVGVKRPNPNGVESSGDRAGDPSSSPKRQRTNDLEPQNSLPASQQYSSVDNSGRMIADNKAPSTPPVHPFPNDVSGSQHQSAYDPYGMRETPTNEGWRTDAHRSIEHRPRGRPRGSGSRGGRVRKSMPARMHQVTTSDWETDDWQTIPDSQQGPDEYYSPSSRGGRGIARRGSGGGGRGGYAQSDRAVSLGLQGVSPSLSLGAMHDPYSHTKKTRSKPIRNADGILIRKDGRPDMRSQSSAANLRRVHARREEEQASQSPYSLTPTTVHHSAYGLGADTPSPSSRDQDHDVTASVQKKHNSIMGKMFPDGVDVSRKQHDYAHQVFEDDQDHTAQPRNRRHSMSQVHRKSTTLEKQVQPDESRTAVEGSPGDDAGSVNKPKKEVDHVVDDTRGAQDDHHTVVDKA